MNWLQFAVQWLHILLGIYWFGNALVVATVLIPTLNRFPLSVQRDVGGGYGELSSRILDVVIPAVIVLGVVRGTLLGPIDSPEKAFTTPYGITWLVALVVATGMYLWGKFVIEPSVRTMNAIPLSAEGSATSELEAPPTASNAP